MTPVLSFMYGFRLITGRLYNFGKPAVECVNSLHQLFHYLNELKLWFVGHEPRRGDGAALSFMYSFR